MWKRERQDKHDHEIKCPLQGLIKKGTLNKNKKGQSTVVVDSSVTYPWDES